jgi:peptidoglycan/xylan/chitin deacetylase (PgdA/CDA1 family)
VTPHYAASPLAMRVIHGNFGRMVQQMTYHLEGRPITPENAIDQFFPYTIFHDYYGFHIWPENLGFVPLPTEGGTPKHVDDMLEAARLHKVVRDAWASFFWHPPLIRTPIGIQSLEKLIDGIRAEGYEFVSLQELRRRGE